jgi:pyruvate formate-lyase/glycerol dehydratase family glycyl radical enzyme
MGRAGDARARIARLREDAMGRGGSFLPDANPFLRDVALWRAACKRTACKERTARGLRSTRSQRSRVQVRAAFLHELVQLAPIEVRPGWTLAGEHLLADPGTRFGFQGDPAPAEMARVYELGVTRDEVDAVRDTVRAWVNGTGAGPAYVDLGETPPELERARGTWHDERSTVVYWASGWIENHSIRDYAKVLRVGWRGIRREVEEQIAAADLADPDLPRKDNFWRAALHVCDAGIALGRRYAERAAELAADAYDPDERARLLEMAGRCARVPAEGARTFAEAVQSLWLAHILTCGEDGINANSIGRLDQILYPWYQADVEAGLLARSEALELMQELACKLYLDYDVQAITLGGVDRQGRDATNELSHLILNATREVDLIRDVSVRLHRDSPPAFVHLASELIVRGGGIPFIFNDECYIPALHAHGIALEDARDYAPIGCIELTIPGRANPHAVSGWFNSTKCLELALYDGVDPRSGEQLGPHTGRLEEMGSFEELYDAYARQVDFFARQMVYHVNRGELAQRERGPLPCWSTLTDDCIARGRDITDGGALYNYHSICFLGTANTADAMMALKKLVYEEGLLDPADLLQALQDDFKGHESVRQMLLKRASKYGNDCPEVDALARRVAEDFISTMDGMRSPLGGRYFVHLFSFLCHLPFGKTVGATPDGRRAGEPLAYSLSAHQGRDERGLTAMLHSLARMPHERAAGATAAILEVDPALVEGEAGVERMAQTIQGAMAMGVGQLQWNVVTVERLLQAQRDPERYGNIAVRVAGYSQMFKLVNVELQDHIIARTKHRR